MKAFHNDEKIKEFYLKRVRDHREADEIQKGYYWQNGKGCAVGCTIHGNNHSKYETELGIPEWLAHLEDSIFEYLPNERAKEWPEEFLSSIRVGDNLERVKAPFLIFLLESTLEIFDHNKFPAAFKSVQDSISLWRRDDIGSDEFKLAADAAAEAAARAAEDAARAAEDAARAADAAARAAEAAADAESFAASYEKFADKLLEILRGGFEGPEKNAIAWANLRGEIWHKEKIF